MNIILVIPLENLDKILAVLQCEFGSIRQALLLECSFDHAAVSGDPGALRSIGKVHADAGISECLHLLLSCLGEGVANKYNIALILGHVKQES